MATSGTFLKPIFIAGAQYPVGAATIDDSLVSQLDRATFVPDSEPNPDVDNNKQLTEAESSATAIATAATRAHNDDAAAHGLHVYNVLDFGTISATEPVSHTAIQAAIDAAYAAGGGTVLLPPQKMLLGASLVPRSGVTVRGVANSVTPSSTSFDLGWVVDSGTVLSYPGGNIFDRPEVGYSDSDYLVAFSIENLGAHNFARFFRCGSRSHVGWSGSYCRNVFLSSASEYAFDLANFQHLEFDHVKAGNVKGFLHLWCDSRAADLLPDGDFTSPGNSVFTDCYCYQNQSGTIYHGVHIENVSGTSGILGSLSFYRLQVNRFNSGATTTSAVRISGVSTKPHPALVFDGIDLEGYGQYGMHLSYVDRCSIQIAGITTDVANFPITIKGDHINGLSVQNPHIASIIELDDGASNDTAFITGEWVRCGTTNLRPVGFYRDKSRSAGVAFQFDHYDNSRILGDDFSLKYAGTLSFEGSRLKRRIVSQSTTGTLAEGYASDVVKTTVAGITVTMPSATNCASETTRYVNTSGGSVTLAGISGGNVTLAAGSVADVQAVSGAWYLVNKQGS